jgi:hypothetical protein
MSEKFENINGQKKRQKKTDNDLHNTTEKTKDLARGIQQQSEIKCSEWVRRSCFTYDPFSLTLVTNLVLSQER